MINLFKSLITIILFFFKSIIDKFKKTQNLPAPSLPTTGDPNTKNTEKPKDYSLSNEILNSAVNCDKNDNMPEYYVLSDVHNHYIDMINAIEKSGFDPNNKNHYFISLGNLTSGIITDEETKQCINYVLSIPEERRILLAGEKEDALIDKYTNLTRKGKNVLPFCIIEYIHSLKNFYETEKCIFTSSWIPTIELDDGTYIYDHNWRKAKPFNWREAHWLDPSLQSEYGTNQTHKDIICGNYLASESWVAEGGLSSHNIYPGVDYININGGIYCEDGQGKINVMRVKYI